MRVIFVVKNQNALRIGSRCEMNRQRALPFDSRLHLALDGQDHVGGRGMGHRAIQSRVSE
ncbi:hypothetical protein BLA13014_06484 [Burkholderia aenigmatica]|uniref:Uncharacterized protein n=1 Tax=Burkholderia aenigmatica TaxID=2015348 RepID=A0A6P2RN94_9BURK|nr:MULTISPECIES: hypothetical protein [Burkholderia]VWC34768.1 hypothetical protein BLA13014_06484 [Burkholderia aenigmatica]